MIKHCLNCGIEYNAKTKRSRFCTEHCSIEYYPRSHTNKSCLICGDSFYSNAPNNVCCSTECKMRLAHKNGTMSYWKCIEEERNIPSLSVWINNEHNNKMRTIWDIANELNASRISIMRWCKMWGIKTRTVSEDNNRRYANMSTEQIREQTTSANIKTRELFSNNEWKANKIHELLSAQNFRESKPEIAMKQALIDHGYGDFDPQYQLGFYSIDIAYPQYKLAIEIDGEYWHSLPEVVSKDKRKNSYIQNYCKWEPLRIPATPCIKNTENVVWEIIQHIETLKQEAKYEEAV
jgi:very-short-patch-repair endonuclease